MQRLIVLLLALAMCFALCACSQNHAAQEIEATEAPAATEAPTEATIPEVQYHLGETVATDIAEFTLDRADLAIALENTYNENYLLPKEYSPEEDNDNPYVAPIGSSLVAITYTIRNLNRNSLDLDGSFNGYLFSVAYGDFSGSVETHYGRERPEGGEWTIYESSNVLLSAGEKTSYRCYVEAKFEPADLNDDFEITVTLPHSTGDKETFTYTVTASDRAASVEREQAEKEAAEQAAQAELDALFADADPQVVEEVTEILQGEWEYTSDIAYYELSFDGDQVTVTTSIGSSTLSNWGTFKVCKGAILITYENGNQAYLPYTYENGEIEISPIIGI